MELKINKKGFFRSYWLGKTKVIKQEWKKYSVFYYSAYFKSFQNSRIFLVYGKEKVWWEDINNLSNLNLSLNMNEMLSIFLEDDLNEFFYYKNGDN